MKGINLPTMKERHMETPNQEQTPEQLVIEFNDDCTTDRRRSEIFEYIKSTNELKIAYRSLLNKEISKAFGGDLNEFHCNFSSDFDFYLLHSFFNYDPSRSDNFLKYAYFNIYYGIKQSSPVSILNTRTLTSSNSRTICDSLGRTMESMDDLKDEMVESDIVDVLYRLSDEKINSIIEKMKLNITPERLIKYAEDIRIAKERKNDLTSEDSVLHVSDKICEFDEFERTDFLRFLDESFNEFIESEKDEKRKEVYRMWRTGKYTTREIAKQVGFKPVWTGVLINRYLKEGMKARLQSKWPEFMQNAGVLEYFDNDTMNQVFV